ncbi:MAG TPA: lysophospholipid acyltransferase family protein [Steroidobacteraceae bacterium]|nr:lysophospholipid acyltransferase family protein [Steroidobacteraceae bacterium]
MSQPLDDNAFTWERARRRWLFVFARTLMRLGGFGAARPIGAALGALHYLLGATERRRCLADLAPLLGRGPGDPLVEATLRNAYRVNTIAVLEVLSMVDRQLDAARLAGNCKVDGLEHLERARTGRGAILLATHSGNSLLLAAQLATQGLPVTVVYRQARMMSMQFFAEGLPRYGIDGILANEGFRAYARMVDALRHNRILFAMMDQGVKKAETGVEMTFLGKRMPMPGGVMQLARQTRAPIVPVVALESDPVWRFAIEPALRFQPGGTLEEDMAVVLAEVERQILAHPELWSWQQRRWRDFALAES